MGIFGVTTWCTKARGKCSYGLLLVAALGMLLASASPALGLSFPDVPSNHPYVKAIDELSDRNIIAGYTNGKFGPADLVMRQQFAKMIVLTLGLQVTEADVCPFPDVQVSGPGSFYPDNYVAVVAKNKITLGTTPTTFSPWSNISRAQVITMVVRAAEKLYPGMLAAPPPGYNSTWDPGFNPIHGPNARKAEFNGLLAGLPLASLGPWDMMPRGEVAQVLYNLLLKLQPSQAGRDLLHLWRTGGPWQVENLSQKYGYKIDGPAASWVLGGRENLAVRSGNGDLLWFHRPVAQTGWQVNNLTQETGGPKITGAVSFWAHVGAAGTTEHLAAVNSQGEVVLYHRLAPAGEWGTVNVTKKAGGQKVGGPVAGWDTPGASEPANIAARAPNGDLLLFVGAADKKWRVENLTQTIGCPKVTGAAAFWEAFFGSRRVEKLAAMAMNGDLIVFWRNPPGGWKFINPSNITGFKIKASPVGWITTTTPEVVESVAARSPNGDLLHFYWSFSAGWKATNVSQPNGRKVSDGVAAWRSVYNTNPLRMVEHLAGVDPDGDVVVFWRIAPVGSWAVEQNLPGDKMVGQLTAWVTKVGGQQVEHLAGMKGD